MTGAELQGVDPRLLAHPHPEPRPYYLTLRTWNYSWWRPFAGLVTAVVMFFLVPVVALPVLFIGLLLDGGTKDYWHRFAQEGTGSVVGPAGLLWLNLSIAALVPLVWLIVRLFHRMRLRWVSSVRPGLRWKFLFACLGFAVVALIASMIVGTLLPAGGDSSVTSHLNKFTATTAALGLVVLLTTPLQAAGEEYLFRGYLLQAFGVLLETRYAASVTSGVLLLAGPGGWSPLALLVKFLVGAAVGFVVSFAGVKYVAMLGSAFLFTLAHGGQNFPLFFDRFSFGLVAAWLVVWTGGLEAGIAMHALNNILAFGLAILFGDIGSSLNVSSISWWNIPVTITQSVVYAALIVWLARMMRVHNRTTPPLGEPIPGFDLQPTRPRA